MITETGSPRQDYSNIYHLTGSNLHQIDINYVLQDHIGVILI